MIQTWNTPLRNLQSRRPGARFRRIRRRRFQIRTKPLCLSLLTASSILQNGGYVLTVYQPIVLVFVYDMRSGRVYHYQLTRLDMYVFRKHPADRDNPVKRKLLFDVRNSRLSVHMLGLVYAPAQDVVVLRNYHVNPPLYRRPCLLKSNGTCVRRTQSRRRA